jgi:hypothetical protein
MKRNFGVKQKIIDPAVKKFFPWALFLVVAALFMLGSCVIAHSEEPVPKPTPLSYADWTCEKLRGYLATHSEAEARATAIEMHLPKWLVRKAEKCIQ